MQRGPPRPIIGPAVSMKRGQAALESALIMPLMVFFVLGIVQLAMVQQARLLTEYAAFQAARAGIVWNGSVERMHDAAVIALAPSIGPHTDSLPGLAAAYQRHETNSAALQGLGWTSSPAAINGIKLRGQIRVDTVNPSPLYGNDFSIWKLSGGNRWDELDFDGVDSYPEDPALEAHLSKFYNLTSPDSDEEAYRNDTLLQIRLRYLYEMRVPFANQIIFLAWYAANADVALYGEIGRSSTTKQNMLGRSGDASSLRGAARGLGLSQKGYQTVSPGDMGVLWDLASGAVPFGGADKHYFFPLSATHSMRMQSNFHSKWLMHR